MECREKELLSEERNRGVRSVMGDGEVVIELIRKIALRQGIGTFSRRSEEGSRTNRKGFMEVGDSC